jgi:hypothetical protein
MNKSDRDIWEKGYKRGKEIGTDFTSRKMYLNNSDARKQGAQIERNKTLQILNSQIEILKDNINNTDSIPLRQAWALAAIELTEAIRLIKEQAD